MRCNGYTLLYAEVPLVLDFLWTVVGDVDVTSNFCVVQDAAEIHLKQNHMGALHCRLPYN